MKDCSPKGVLFFVPGELNDIEEPAAATLEQQQISALQGVEKGGILNIYNSSER